MNEDGTMSRVPELAKFAKAHGVENGDDQGADRISRAPGDVCSAGRQCRNADIFGEFEAVAFENEMDGGTHIALVKGPSG